MHWKKLLGVLCTVTFANVLPPHASLAYASLTLSGTPRSQIAVGQHYSFTPKVSNASSGTLFLRLHGIKPDWATFTSKTGTLSGTPTKAGRWPNLAIVGWDGVSSSSIHFSITATSSSGAGGATAVKISGTPAATIGVGQYYGFKPTVTAASGAKLTYRVVGKPSWATFSTSSGLLSGTPVAGNVAIFSGISIGVSDGKTSASLPAFKITVSPAPTGGATLSWTRPVKNTDGSALTNLAGYHIVYGSSASSLSRTLSIGSPSTTSASIENLSSGTWYFAVISVTSNGIDSALSAIASKKIL